MPTPSPISAASVGPNTGMLIAWESNPTVRMPDANATIAASSGSAIANSDPNAMNNTRPAASTPMASLFDGGTWLTCRTAGPPSSTCSLADRVPSARSMTCWTSAGLRFCACASNVTVAYAVRPSAESWAAPCGVYGLDTAATDGASTTAPSIAVTGCCTAGSVTDPVSTCQTCLLYTSPSPRDG